MAEIYTISILKKNVVNLSKEAPSTTHEDLIEIKSGSKNKATQFTANYNNSSIFFSVPQETILVLGRFFQKKKKLELGYLLEEDIWYILEKGTLLWSSKVLKLKKEKKISKTTRYDILKRNSNTHSQ